MPTEDILSKGTAEILARLQPLEATPVKNAPKKAEALLGGVQTPPLMLSDCFEKFMEFSRADLVSKSGGQQKR